MLDIKSIMKEISLDLVADDVKTFEAGIVKVGNLVEKCKFQQTHDPVSTKSPK